MTVVSPIAVIPAWDDLTDDQRRRYQGNLDPWAGPVDPNARQPRVPAQRGNEDACGCWENDCAECGPRRADGQRPAKGQRRAWALRQDAALQQAKETYAQSLR